jgi:replication factor A1
VNKIARSKKSSGEYLALLAVKHDVDADELFHALLSAGEIGESKCDHLSVECRGKKNGKVIFMISEGSEVVAQLPISEQFLSRQGNPIRSHMTTGLAREYSNRQVDSDRSWSIQDLRVGMKRVNLKAEVLEVSEPRRLVTRYGNNACLAKALVSDGTGEIKICLWNESVDAVSEGDTVQVGNARVTVFKGEKQLSLGKTGTLEVIENPASDVADGMVVAEP